MNPRDQNRRSETRLVERSWNVGKKSIPNTSLLMRVMCLSVGEPDLNVQCPAGHSEGLRDQGKEL